jgi:hypothetical protein
MDLRKIVVRTADITVMQEKAIDFLKEVAAKERAEALKAARAAVSIETVTKMTTVSQHSNSSVVTGVAATTTPLMARQIFRDFLISTRSKKLPIHDSIKKCKSYSSCIYNDFLAEGYNIICSIQWR